MTSFIFEVLQDLKRKGYPLTDLNYILPSKRAGLFLKQELSKTLNTTFFSPEIISIEFFVEELSQLKKESNTELLFHLYSAYSQLEKEKAEPFEEFIKWGQILLQDFNEIDRYLVPQNKLFNYLNAIQDLNHWSKNDEKTNLVSNYLTFWNKLPALYSIFQNILLENGIAYQGLVYREAQENIEYYIQNTQRKKHVFIGFNALNKAEETIIQELLKNNLAEIYWDIDSSFLENSIHDASLFLRNYKSKWKFYNQNSFELISNSYSHEKNITTYAVSKNTGQAKYIGQLLASILETNRTLENTAVVLADESLLIPVLNSLPKEIQHVNITMGLPLDNIPLTSLFEKLFNIQSRSSKGNLYYKDVIAILSNPYVRQLYFEKEDYASKITETLEADNFIYFNLEELLRLNETNESKVLSELLFSNWDNPSIALENCSSLILKIKNSLPLEKRKNLLQLEYLFRFNTIFNELQRLNDAFEYIKDIHTLQGFFKELLRSESLDFQGEPLQGLQIMGMLETRVLDFETVIIASVNEGFLPAGKTNNSFIPYDVKLEYGLPTFKEKDAVYAYHFYHLLQRAKNVHVLYNTEVDALKGGEKSRFITQLEVEGVHNIQHKTVIPKIPIHQASFKTIKKTPEVMSKLKIIAKEGFSPSSLTAYIRNPIDFYYQKILGIKEYDEVEETVADNTLGTVIHNTLEDLYEPYVGSFISESNIKKMISKTDITINSHFKKIYKSGDITKGKNLIVFEVAKRYVFNFLKHEIDVLKKGHTIKIIALEQSCEAHLKFSDFDFNIKMRGKVDRVDMLDGVTRIIDYKTGRVEQNQIQVIDWNDITTDYKKYSKPFQVLSYALMLHQSNIIDLPVEAGIVSFKNLGNGFMKFSKKGTPDNPKLVNTLVDQKVLNAFQEQLKILFMEIFNVTVDFIEKEVK